jgi:hypothetical protein
MADESFVLQGLMMLKDIGFFDFLLPFLLFFTVIYGALEKTKVFGENRRDINSVIALVVALIATTTAMVTKVLAGFLPWVGFIAIVIVCFLMIVALMIGDVSKLAEIPKFKEASIVIVALLIFIVLFFALGLQQYLPAINISETDIALSIIIVIVIAVLYFIFRDSGTAVPPKS